MSPGGRPSVGPAINMRFPADMLAAVDKLAAELGIKRAETIRLLIGEALQARGGAR